MRRVFISMSALAGLGVLLGGILLWRKVGAPRRLEFREITDPDALDRIRHAFERQHAGFGPHDREPY